MAQDFSSFAPVLSTPIANQSINSMASVLFEIQREEAKHWFFGLRAAELFITQKESAIATALLNARKFDRELEAKQERISTLELFTSPTPEQRRDLEGLRDEVAFAALSRAQLDIGLRDAEMELNTALSERNRIWGNAIAMHPEISEMTFDEIQKRFTPEAHIEGLARFLAARIWAAQNSIPLEVGVTLFDLPHGVTQGCQTQVLRRALDLSNRVTGNIHHEAVIEAISQYPDISRTELLDKAAQLILQDRQRGAS